MKIIQYIYDLTKEVARSRAAWTLFFIHLMLLIIACFQKGTIQPIHFEYEFLLYKFLFFINVPASVVTGILLLPIALLTLPINSETTYNGSYPLIVFIYIGWQIQWALIGYGIEKLFRHKKKNLL